MTVMIVVEELEAVAIVAFADSMMISFGDSLVVSIVT